MRVIIRLFRKERVRRFPKLKTLSQMQCSKRRPELSSSKFTRVKRKSGTLVSRCAWNIHRLLFPRDRFAIRRATSRAAFLTRVVALPPSTKSNAGTNRGRVRPCNRFFRKKASFPRFARTKYANQAVRRSRGSDTTVRAPRKRERSVYARTRGTRAFRRDLGGIMNSNPRSHTPDALTRHHLHTLPCASNVRPSGLESSSSLSRESLSGHFFRRLPRRVISRDKTTGGIRSSAQTRRWIATGGRGQGL